MFSQASVINPPGQTPRADTPPRKTPPLGRHPPGRHPPPDGHCSGRYASYWNAFLCQRTWLKKQVTTRKKSECKEYLSNEICHQLFIASETYMRKGDYCRSQKVGNLRYPVLAPGWFCKKRFIFKRV